MRILFVDDNEGLVELFKTLADFVGFEGIGMTSSPRAIEYLNLADNIDITIMDLALPTIDGLTAIKTIRMNENSQGMARSRILIYTGHDFDYNDPYDPTSISLKELGIPREDVHYKKEPLSDLLKNLGEAKNANIN